MKQRETDAREQEALEAIRKDTEELAAFEALLQEAQRWQQFKVLYSYLEELGRNGSSTPAFRQWLSWATERRRVFDPGQLRREKDQ